MRPQLVPTMVVLALVAAAAISLLAPARATAGYYVKCPVFTGPRWNQSPHFGTKYETLAHGLKCSFVVHWAKLLAAKRSAGPGKVLAGGPPGYRCTTNNPKGFRASQGSCQKGAAAYFNWAPKIA
jgi:hypothetical protein